MVRKVEVQLVDDIDGTAADETVRFALDGTRYEVDLTAKRARKLRTDLNRFVIAARRTGQGRAVSRGRGRVGGEPARIDRAQNRAVREWAKRKKIALSDRGRIPRSIIEQYQQHAGR